MSMASWYIFHLLSECWIIIIMKVVIWMMENLINNLSLTHHQNDGDFEPLTFFPVRQNLNLLFFLLLQNLKKLFFYHHSYQTKSISHNMEYHKWQSSTMRMLSAIFSFNLRSRHFSLSSYWYFMASHLNVMSTACTRKNILQVKWHIPSWGNTQWKLSRCVEDIHLHIIMFHLH